MLYVRDSIKILCVAFICTIAASERKKNSADYRQRDFEYFADSDFPFLVAVSCGDGRRINGFI